MKKLLLAGALIISIGALTGCEDTGYQYPGTTFIVVKKLGNGNRIVRDINTGCMYFHEQSRGTTPYYDKDGKVMGCGDKRSGDDIYK